MKTKFTEGGEHLHIRMPVGLLEACQKAAHSDGATVSSWVRMLIAREIKKAAKGAT